MKGEPGGKGDKRRPTLNQQLADLGEAIWREKDPKKKAELTAEWYELKWKQAINRQGEWQ
jgi:hypothetical protein